MHTFVESHLELQSRKKHWEKILKKAEKEAFEAYLANDRKSNGGYDGRREQMHARSKGKSQSPQQAPNGRGHPSMADSPSNGSTSGGRAGAQRGGGGNGLAGDGNQDSPMSRSPPTSSLRRAAGGNFAGKGSPVPRLNLSTLGGK